MYHRAYIKKGSIKNWNMLNLIFLQFLFAASLKHFATVNLTRDNHFKRCFQIVSLDKLAKQNKLFFPLT